MRTCPYCLYRFPDDAPGCPRCDNILPRVTPPKKDEVVALPLRPSVSPRQWMPLAIGGVLILALLGIALVTVPRLLSSRPTTARPVANVTRSISMQATAPAGFPTPQPPAGWREWLVAGDRLKVWLPESYQVVNFSVSDWQTVYSTTLLQDSYLSQQAGRFKSGTFTNTLLVGVSGRTDPAPVRVMLSSAPSLIGNESPKPEDLKPLVYKMGWEGDLKNTRTLPVPDVTCDVQIKMTQMEIIPPKLDDPTAWRGFVLAATSPHSAYLMTAVVTPRNFATLRTMLEKILGSACGTPSELWPTPTPLPTPTPIPPTPTPVITPTPTLPTGWSEWHVQELKLWLPQTFNVVDFTDKNWSTVYSTTLKRDDYLQSEANKVKAGTSRNVWLIATSPATETVSVRVLVLHTPQFTGTVPPTPVEIQPIIEKLGVTGGLSKATPLEPCGALRTRMDLRPPTASKWGGSVVTATGPNHGYLLIVLFSPQRATDLAAVEKIGESLCVIGQER